MLYKDEILDIWSNSKMQEQVQEWNPPFSRWDSCPWTSHSAAKSKECKPEV